MKKLCCSLLVIWLATGGISVAFAEEECINAVDAADSMNVNQQECDYSDKGLNGFLQKAFKKGSEGAVLNTSTEAENKTTNTNAGSEKASVANNRNIPESNNTAVLSMEVEQWANITLAKNQLLQKVMAHCNQGFNVIGEIYRPLPMGRIQLGLEYSCF